MLSQQVEEYLEAVGRLEERGQAVTTSSLARERGVSLPSATEMLQRMADQGLVIYEQRKQARLTPAGRRQAATVVRRHRLWERFLHDVLGIGWDQVHDEACRLEHATSSDVESRLASVLGDVATCPHGNAIPGSSSDLAPAQAATLTALEIGQTARVVSVREDSAFLRRIDALGIRPGVVVRVASRSASAIELTVESPTQPPAGAARLSLDLSEAEGIVALPVSIVAPPTDDLELTLSDLPGGERALVRELRGGGAFVGRCLALGFTPGAPVRMVQNSGGGPLIALVRDTRVALGRGEARRVRVVRETPDSALVGQ